MAEMQGLDRVLALFQRLPVEMREAAKAQVEIEANEFANAARRVVTVGKTGNLKASIRARKGNGPANWLVSAGGPLTTVKVRKGVKDSDFAKAKISGGHKGEYDYSRGIEFGHVDEAGRYVPARPFFWPLYRSRKAAMKRRIMAAARKPLKTLYPKEAG